MLGFKSYISVALQKDHDINITLEFAAYEPS